MNIAICTCENYNCTQSVGVIKEQMRELKVKELSHVNYDPELSYKNITLEHDKNIDKHTNFRSYVKDFHDKEEIQGRFNIDTTGNRATTTLSSFVVSGSKDFIESFESREALVDYFKEALTFLKEEYKDFHLVDARIHNDEKGLPHMHASFLPVVEREDKTKQFNVSKAQPGKFYFKGFQDRYFEHMKEKYPEKDLQRTDPNRDHVRKMSVKEYKEYKEIQREFKDRVIDTKEKIEKIRDIENRASERHQELQRYDNYFDKVQQYCDDRGLTLFQYQKDVFYAERGLANFPSPENYNPDREINQQQNEHEITRQYEHER